MTSSLPGHHCSHLGSKTVDVDVHSTGKTGLGLNLTAFNATIRKSPTTGGYELVFDFHADVVVLVLSWNVDDVVAHNCKIKILGIGAYTCTQERVTAPRVRERQRDRDRERQRERDRDRDRERDSFALPKEATQQSIIPSNPHP